MKKLIVVALLFVGVTSFAQVKEGRVERADSEKMSVEQRSELRLKKLTTELDLNVSQQKEMSKIIAELEAKREVAKAARKARKEKGEKLSGDERFEMKNKMLDEQNAMKDRVKKILTPDQFLKWESDRREKREKMNEKKENRDFKKQE